MNETESLVAELKSLRPSRVPEELSTQLERGLGETRLADRSRPIREATSPLPWLFRWLVPGAAVASLIAFLAFHQHPVRTSPPVIANTTISSALKADDVQVNRELVANFDAVTRLPGGVPVRFRCQEWVENVRLRDSERGIWVEQRVPRLEIIPVRYETY